MTRIFSFFSLLALVSHGNAAVDFSHQIVPVLREHCSECHAGDKKKGGFSFNTREALMEGSENGEVVRIGKSAESRMIEVLLSTEKDEQMPPKGARLLPEKIALLKQWIDEGAKWEPGFAFKKEAYEPPLKPRKPALPAAVNGREHPVDRILDAYLADKKVPAPKPVSDETFLRRVSLDISGLLPSVEKRAAFLADPAPDKRAKLARALLDDKQAYTEHWLVFWNDLLRNDYAGTGYIDGGRRQITGWMYRALIENKPYDEFVRELIAPGPEAEGFINGIKWRGNVNASQVREIQFAQNLGQVFLGINLKCASCHDSFIDRWKLDEAYGMAAIYATEPLEIHRCDVPQGRKASAAWIFPELGNVKADAPQPERLKQLAALMTSTENGRFSRTIVNRLWHRLMGRGIAHPVDAMGTEPWSADLLDHLATFLIENGHDLKRVIEHIVTSQAYQSESVAGAESSAADAYVYRGPVARRLTAEQFMDAVWLLTGTSPKKTDASVLRGAPKPASKTLNEPLLAKWIWSNPDFRKAKGGEQATFRRVFKLPDEFTSAVMAITCDNQYRVIVNGKEVAADDSLTSVEIVPLTGHLRAGANNVMIVAKNGGKGVNAAALIAELRVITRGDKPMVIATDADWEWSAAVPDARAKLQEGAAWAKAVAIEGAPVYARFEQQIKAALAGAPTDDGGMVRASLVKSNLLMRSLGRPNREQVVTERPAVFTTLEAIDLANGQLLTGLLAEGAKSLAARHGDAAAFTQWLFQSALSRDPNPAEIEALKPLLQGKLDESSASDLLWAVLMLPDFQLVR